MSKKGWMIIGIYIVVAVATLSVLLGKKYFIPKQIHAHAGFVVFENDKKKDFSGIKYMEIRPCKVDNSEKEEVVSDEEIQRQKAHLHENVGDVVHVEREGAKWKDLFTNLHYQVDYAKITAYVNGKEVKNFQNNQIQAYDSLVVFIGQNKKKELLSQAVAKSHIQGEEKKSEDCSM